MFVDLAFDTEDDMIEHLKTASNVFGGIVFLFNGDTKLPRNITYKIRLRAELYAATFGLDDARKDTDRLTDHTYPSMPTAGPGQQNDMCGENKTGRLMTAGSIRFENWGGVVSLGLKTGSHESYKFNR